MTIMAIGSALSAGGSIAGGFSSAKAAKAQAKEKMLTANEILVRANINKRARELQGQQERATIGSGIMSSGFTQESSMSMINASLANEIEDKLNIEREAAWSSEAYKREAGALRKEAKASILGGLLQGGAGLTRAFGEYSAAKGTKSEDGTGKSVK